MKISTSNWIRGCPALFVFNKQENWSMMIQSRQITPYHFHTSNRKSRLLTTLPKEVLEAKRRHLYTKNKSRSCMIWLTTTQNWYRLTKDLGKTTEQNWRLYNRQTNHQSVELASLSQNSPETYRYQHIVATFHRNGNITSKRSFTCHYQVTNHIKIKTQFTIHKESQPKTME